MKKNEAKQFNILINSIRHGDKDSLEKLYSLYGRLIYSVALSTSGSSFLADEIVDDVLIKLWSQQETHKTIKNPRGWLYVITLNCAKDKLKSQKRDAELFDGLYNDVNIENVLEVDAFYNDIACLDEQEKQIIIFKYIVDMTFKEIAKEIKIPQSTVSSIYYRALEKIKENMSKNNS